MDRRYRATHPCEYSPIKCPLPLLSLPRKTSAQKYTSSKLIPLSFRPELLISQAAVNVRLQVGGLLRGC